MLATKLWKAFNYMGLIRLVMGHYISGSIQPIPFKSEERLPLPGTDLPGWLSKVALRHYNTWSISGPASSTVLSLFGSQERTLCVPEVDGNFFPAFRKERQHFLSQNNLSLCLTRLPAIFTQLKLQMIYFQLHKSPALWHMVLSITLVRAEQNRHSSEPLNQTEWATEKGKNRKESRKELRKLGGTNSDFLCWLAFVVRGSRDTHHSEWNYWAFIKQTAGPLWSLKAAAKHSPPARFPPKVLLCFCMRDTARDIY